MSESNAAYHWRMHIEWCKRCNPRKNYICPEGKELSAAADVEARKEWAQANPVAQQEGADRG